MWGRMMPQHITASHKMEILDEGDCANPCIDVEVKQMPKQQHIPELQSQPTWYIERWSPKASTLEFSTQKPHSLILLLNDL